MKFNKPILVICPTRYELPYTGNPEMWEELNATLLRGVQSGQVTLFANSKAEQMYLEYYSGIRAEIIQTVCDYISSGWDRDSDSFIYFSRSQEISKEIEQSTDNIWQPANAVLGMNYSWQKLMSVAGVFVLPYNNNTMHLFELAAAGVPVAVPSKKFLRELWSRNDDAGVMSEVSSFRVFSLSIDELNEDDPSNYRSSSFKDYWIDLCDFYDKNLMPNIIEIDSFADLRNFKPRNNLKEITDLRNDKYKHLRNEKMSSFFMSL